MPKREGVPDSPDAWLLTMAKRRLLKTARHDKVRFDPAVCALLAKDEAEVHTFTIPDARLKPVQHRLPVAGTRCKSQELAGDDL